MCTGGSICSRLFWNQLESACFPGALQMSNSALVVLSSDMQALLVVRHGRWLWLHSDKSENGDCLRNLGHVALCLHTHTYTHALLLPCLLYHNNPSFVKDDWWHVGISFMEFCVLELLWRPGINRLRPGIEFHQRETTARAFKRLNKQLLLIWLRIMGELSFTKCLLFTRTIDQGVHIPRSWPQCKFNSSSFHRIKMWRPKSEIIFKTTCQWKEPVYLTHSRLYNYYIRCFIYFFIYFLWGLQLEPGYPKFGCLNAVYNFYSQDLS